MSEPTAPGDRSIEEMCAAFWRTATRNRPGRKTPPEVRAAYYAGCYNMLDEMIKMLRAGDSGNWGAVWQKWVDETVKFAEDYNAGKV